MTPRTRGPIDPRSWARETRLLVVTIVLSVSVLVLLARFRFPSQELLELPAQPLQRLAARAAFEDLAVSAARASEQVRPFVFVVTLAPTDTAPRSYGVGDLLKAPGGLGVTALAVAYQFRPDAALVLSNTPGAPSGPGARGTELRARDDLRGLSVLRTATAAAGWQPVVASTPTGPQYVLAAEPTPGGVAIRPLFALNADTFQASSWQQPLIGLGTQPRAPHGALLFAMDGSFVGAVVDTAQGQGIVPSAVLLAAADRLLSAPASVPSTIGVRLQAMDPLLAQATGVSSGVAVAGVEPEGPAGAVLVPGDVITHVGETPLTTPAGALRVLSGLPAQQPAELRIQRDGAPVSVTITPRPLDEHGGVGTSAELGLALRTTARGSLVTRVDRASAGEAAGIRAGDLVTRIGSVEAPRPAAVTSAWTKLASGAFVLVAVERDGSPLLLALRRP